MSLTVLDYLRLDLILERVEERLGRQTASDNQAEIVGDVVAFVILPDGVDIQYSESAHQSSGLALICASWRVNCPLRPKGSRHKYALYSSVVDILELHQFT